MPKVKPRLTPREVAWVCAVDAYVRQYQVRGRNLASAFSDVHDGRLFPRDVAPLVEQGLLAIKPLRGGPETFTDLLGDRFTVSLTPRACRIFWKSRCP